MSRQCALCDEMGIQDYKLDANRIIRAPGKFEGEPSYALHFFHIMMDGGGEGEDMGVETFTVDQFDVDCFPEDLKLGDVVELWVRDDGFVCTKHIDAKEKR